MTAAAPVPPTSCEVRVRQELGRGWVWVRHRLGTSWAQVWEGLGKAMGTKLRQHQL